MPPPATVTAEAVATADATEALHADTPRTWELIATHRSRLIGMAVRRGCTREEAEDLASEALLRAGTFAGLDENRVGAFLSTVLVRLVIDQSRQKQRQLRLNPRLAEPGVLPSHEDLVCDRLHGADAHRRLHELSGVERQVLVSRSEGVAVDTIARQMHLSSKTVEGAYTRARRRMRRALAVAGASVGITTGRRWWGLTTTVAAVPVLFFHAVGPVTSSLAPAPLPTPSINVTKTTGSAPLAPKTAPAAVEPPRQVTQPPRLPAAEPASPVAEAPAAATVLVPEPALRHRDEDEPFTQTILRCVEQAPVLTVEAVGCPPTEDEPS